MKLKICIMILLFSIVFAQPVLNIQQVGGNRIIKHPDYPMSLIIKTPRANMSVMSQSSIRQEEDAPVELHQLAGIKIESNGPSVQFIASSAPQIIIAVLDSGIDLDNSQLKPYLFVNSGEIPNNGIDDDHNGFIDDVNGVNMFTQKGNVSDDLGHGTLMSSIIALSSQGHVKILPIKIFDSQGKSSQFLVSCALQYARQMGATVANCSFGYDYYTETLKQEVVDAQSYGLLLVASAGNQGQEKLIYPAAFPNVLAVSSLDGSDHLASFSNYGTFLSVSSIGVDVAGLYPGNQQAFVSGTSASAANVSGLLGLISSKSQQPLTRASIQNYVVDIRDPLGIGANMVGWDKYSGDGKLEMAEVTTQQNTSSNGSLILGAVLSYPNPIRNQNYVQIGFELSRPADIAVKIYDLAGRLRWSIDEIASNMIAGYNKITFEGKDRFGNWLENDTYLVLVTADYNGQRVMGRHRLTILR